MGRFSKLQLKKKMNTFNAEAVLREKEAELAALKKKFFRTRKKYEIKCRQHDMMAEHVKRIIGNKYFYGNVDLPYINNEKHAKTVTELVQAIEKRHYIEDHCGQQPYLYGLSPGEKGPYTGPKPGEPLYYYDQRRKRAEAQYDA